MKLKRLQKCENKPFVKTDIHEIMLLYSIFGNGWSYGTKMVFKIYSNKYIMHNNPEKSLINKVFCMLLFLIQYYFYFHSELYKK